MMRPPIAAWIGTSNIWRGISLRSFSTRSRPLRLRVLRVDDDREGVDGLAVDEDVELHEARGLVAGERVVEAGVALGARLQLVVVVDEDLGQRHVVLEQHARLALRRSRAPASRYSMRLNAPRRAVVSSITAPT